MCSKFYIDWHIKTFQQADASFCPKSRYFEDQTEPQRDQMKINFDPLQ